MVINTNNSLIFRATRPTNILAVLFCVIIFSFLITPVNAWEDNFDDGEIASDWTIVGTWTMESGGMPDGSINYTKNSLGTFSSASLTQSITPINFGYMGIWVKPTSVNNDNERIYFGQNQYIFITNNYVCQIIQPSGTVGVGTLSGNEWNKITVTKSGSNFIVRTYDQNGVLENTLTTAADDTGSTSEAKIARATSANPLTMSYDDYQLLEATLMAANVQWDQDPYYTGGTAIITTIIDGFDNSTYSYYLDIYTTQEYLTTYEITNETEYNYYTFPLGWADTSLLAKLVRVTDPYATNEVELAYDVSLFESLYWDTTVAFNKSSYIPSESLLVTWSGAADGSSVWLQAGDDGEVLESNVSYSGSFTFDVPANTTETYYWVDVVTDGYSQAFAICDISPVPDFFFNYTVSTNLDEYSPGDIVTVTYSSDKICGIRVIKTISDNTYHSVSSLSGGSNKTWQFYISEDEPFGFYDIYLVDISGTILDDVRYSLLPSTSSLEILQLSINLHEEFAIFAQTVNVSFLTIEDPDGVEVWNESVDALMYKYVYYTPTTKYGIYTAYLYDDSTLSDTIMVYYAEAPDIIDPDGPVIDDPVIDEDVLDDDESMTDYFNGKFRDFAPTIWGFFMLMCLLFLMSILTSFNSGGKRR